MTVKRLLPVTALFRFNLHLGMRVKKRKKNTTSCPIMKSTEVIGTR